MSARLNIRIARQEDSEAIMRVRHAVKENLLSDPNQVTVEDCRKFIRSEGRGWVCELEDKIVGFSLAKLDGHSIWALFVDPGFEGKGIGARLLDEAAQWLFETGAESIRLSTDPGTRADKFYQAQGWARGSLNDIEEVEFLLSHPGKRN